MDNQREQEHEAPAALIRGLKRLKAKAIEVPESVDAAVLHAARRRLVQPARKGFGGWNVFRDWPNWTRIPALAAAAVLLLVLAKPLVYPGFAREDLNRDGRVDILDAFALARNIRAGTAAPALDMNGDGAVDRRDADALAGEAVRLQTKGGRS